MLILAGAASVTAALQAASATDWRYCLAPSEAEHRVYMSGAFPVRRVPDDADNAFERTLDRAGVRHDVVQCPRADDEPSIEMMLQYAVDFNHRLGNTVIHIPFENMR
jgi:hypothetical protein